MRLTFPDSAIPLQLKPCVWLFALIGDYVELLLTLAEGRNLADTSGHVQAFAQNVFALTSLASGPGAAAGLTSVLGALEPIIRNAAQQKDIEEMKRLVLSGAPLLKNSLRPFVKLPLRSSTLLFSTPSEARRVRKQWMTRG